MCQQGEIARSSLWTKGGMAHRSHKSLEIRWQAKQALAGKHAGDPALLPLRVPGTGDAAGFCYLFLQVIAFSMSNFMD